jgi:hypothetical protein
MVTTHPPGTFQDRDVDISQRGGDGGVASVSTTVDLKSVSPSSPGWRVRETFTNPVYTSSGASGGMGEFPDSQ